MTTSETIILGVVSGIVTSAFIYLCVNIFNKIILPWYRTAIYSGIDISGSWEEIVNHTGATDHYKTELIQKNCNITGTQTVIKTHKPDGRIETKILAINGHFQDGHVLLTLNNKNKKIQSLSTYLLKINHGGAALIGESTWVDVYQGNIVSRQALLKRSDV